MHFSSLLVEFDINFNQLFKEFLELLPQSTATHITIFRKAVYQTF